jgi:hypothetical protein
MAGGNQRGVASDRITPSPNKRWEYRCSEDGATVRIVKAGTTISLLDLILDPGKDQAKNSAVIWAPDSKRLAFNHWDGSKASGVTLYQLLLDQWVELQAADDKIQPFFDSALAAEMASKHLPERADVRDIAEYVKVSEWIDAHTALLRAVETFGAGKESLALGFVFTIKFGAEGTWEIVASKPLSKEESRSFLLGSQ